MPTHKEDTPSPRNVSRGANHVAPKLTEAQLSRQITDLLELDGWRAVKMEPLSGRGVAQRIIAALRKFPQLHGGSLSLEDTIRKATQNRGAGEEGMPDYLYLRYESFIPVGFTADRPGEATVLWIEHKAPGGKVQQHQLDWHAAERARGAMVLLAGVDFECSAEGFLKWYSGSGLARRGIALSAPKVRGAA